MESQWTKAEWHYVNPTLKVMGKSLWSNKW